jgi:putative endonuclease
MSVSKRDLGQRGEQLAAAYLQQRGYTIIMTNWRCTHGELDIVARKQDTLVFVEVRTRRAHTTEEAFESVKPHKQNRLQRLAYAYLSAHDLHEMDWRVDIVAVAIPGSGQPMIEHVENALGW